MQLRGSKLVLSATDLSNFLGCRHRTALDMAEANGALKATYVAYPLLELLWKRGEEHERAYVESLRSMGRVVRDLRNVSGSAATLDAMREGADVIVQGTLESEGWIGKPDVMLRVDRPSALGPWSYEISDTKLARETRAGTILQLGLYSDLLDRAQGVRPERFFVVTPNVAGPVSAYRVDDYAAYFRQTRDGMLAFTDTPYDVAAEAHYPEPVDHCEICRWRQRCVDRRKADDHLSLVANITRAQRRELESRSVATLTGLAGLPSPVGFKPRRGSVDGYDRARDQAKLQLESRGKTPPLHELLKIDSDKGLCRLPEPSAGDLFLDLEGDAFGGGGEHGREYLFGMARADGSYEARWAFTDVEEQQGFEWVMDAIARAASEHPAMHVYHYAPYEPTAFKRLMGRYATKEREIDAMLRAGRFIDLYAVVRQGLRAGIERYSIKNLEPLYDFQRTVPLADANRGLKATELALGMGLAADIPVDVRAIVEGYNRDDCVSTLRLRDWLERVRAGAIASGQTVPRPAAASADAPAKVDERARRVEELRGRLLAGISENRDERDDEAQGRWLLAYLLDYHRREEKATWWELFRLCELNEEDLLEEREAVAGLEFVERLPPRVGTSGRVTKSVVDRYRYPSQEVEIDTGDGVRTQDTKVFGTVDAIDRARGTIDIYKGPSRADTHPRAVFAFSHVPTDVIEECVARIGERVAESESGYLAARALLAGDPPRVVSGNFERRDGTVLDFAVRVAGELADTVLPIQGPPGAGKTYCGAAMICDLVRQGKKIGVTATGHDVIRHLLEEVETQARLSNTAARIARRPKKGDVAAAGSTIAVLSENSDVVAALESGAANVVGGTAWLWASPELANKVDVLFVDEAGQIALANVVATSQAANCVVLLGDPQQLEQPRKGSHPDGVGVSVLEHILRGKGTIPDDRGIFLPETWRLAPSICAFTSELFYENRLTSRRGLEAQCIHAGDLPRAGLALLEVDHDGNRNFSVEEVDAVGGLVTRLTAPGSTWTNAEGKTQPLLGSDILVVAPYNAHVSRISARVAGTGVRVGTVDKFQGQQAPVVIYAMATSRPEDAPRGMEFLYSINRLNVATSRARCLAVLVSSPRLFEPECRLPQQMKLANALCRYRELATRL